MMVSATKSLVVPDTPFDKIQQITCGEDHSIVRDSAGKVYAWGANNKGQLGNGHYEDTWEIQEMQTLPEWIKDISTCGD